MVSGSSSPRKYKQSIRFVLHHSSVTFQSSASSRPIAARAIRLPKKDESQSRNLHQSQFPMKSAVSARPDRIGRPLHHAEMHASQVLSHNPERKELRARKNRNARREKCESGHRCARKKETPQDKDQQARAK